MYLKNQPESSTLSGNGFHVIAPIVGLVISLVVVIIMIGHPWKEKIRDVSFVNKEMNTSRDTLYTYTAAIAVPGKDTVLETKDWDKKSDIFVGKPQLFTSDANGSIINITWRLATEKTKGKALYPAKVVVVTQHLRKPWAIVIPIVVAILFLLWLRKGFKMDREQ